MTSSPQSNAPYRHSVSVAGVVMDDDGRFLAIRRRDNGHWELPGGILELEESPEEGVVREVDEETGVVVSVSRLTGVYKNMELGVIALVFRCEAVSGEPGPTAEATEVAWLTADEIRNRVDEAYAVRFLDAAAEGTVAMRSHDGVRLVPSA